MIRIKTLGISAGQLNLVFYYEVPLGRHSPESVDDTRTPLGTRLSPQELTQLKAGRIIEYPININIILAFFMNSTGMNC